MTRLRHLQNHRTAILLTSILGSVGAEETTLGGFQVWEISLAVGLGALGLLVVCCLCYRVLYSRTSSVSVSLPRIIDLDTLPSYDGTYNPDGTRRFPKHWGPPPVYPTTEANSKRVILPNDFGFGTPRLKHWVETNLAADRAKLKPGLVKAFPKHWKQPPLEAFRVDGGGMDTLLPGGFGRGSIALKTWIQQRLDYDKVMRLVPVGVERPFPKSWGTEWPKSDKGTRAVMVTLPDGYGKGTTALRDWIKAKLDRRGPPRYSRSNSV